MAATAVAARMECSVVVVGDAKIGKTALIRSLTHNEFTEVGTQYSLALLLLQCSCRVPAKWF